MINFPKTNWLIIVLIIVFFLAGVFFFQWWQVKGELGKQIEQNEILTKQIDELQKEIEELKISKEEIKEEIKDETAEWKTYRNEKQGFEIKFPPIGKWNFDITKTEITRDDIWFDGQFNVLGKENNINFWMRVNLYTESNPPLYVFETACKSERKAIFLDNQISYATYSTLDLERKNLQDCDSALDKFILDKHESEVRFCLDKSSETIYPAKFAILGDPSVGGEYGFSCDVNQDLYYFQLSCQGNEWKGKRGQDKCSQLFNQIISTFKFIK